MPKDRLCWSSQRLQCSELKRRCDRGGSRWRHVTRYPRRAHVFLMPGGAESRGSTERGGTELPSGDRVGKGEAKGRYPSRRRQLTSRQVRADVYAICTKPAK